MPELQDIFGSKARNVRTVPPFPGKRDTSAYQAFGRRIPSVTEILGLAGLSDFSGIPKDVLENAADRGKWAHYFCDLIDHGIEDDQLNIEFEVPEEVWPRIHAYRRFLAESGFEPIESEYVVVSKAFQFAGTVDRIGMLPGVGRVLVDLKLPVMASPAWNLQTAGYAFAYEESASFKIDGRYSLQLSKEARYSLKPGGDDLTDLNDFLAAVRVAHFKIRNGIAKLEN